MRCLEVWGGNRAVDNGVVMAGLDAWLHSRPFRGDAAGGDIHYVSSCAAGMLTRVLVADVSGHGERVAAAAETLRGLMRRYVNYIDQSDLVRGLNSEFGSQADGGAFATAVVASYLTHSSEFTLCNAGHPRPLWFRARLRRWEFMSGPSDAEAGDAPANVPLGIAEPTCYDQVRTRLGTGDLILIYTDSLIEARSPDGRMLGEQGLLALVRDLDASEPSDFLHALLGAVAAYCGDADGHQGDDLTILILRPNGLKPRVPLWVIAKYEARMAKAAVRSLLPGGPAFPWPDTGLSARLGWALNRLNPGWGRSRPAAR
jgi:sigma-B regulation protein RsbU (phosphoserine phosphatase)